MPYTQLNLGLGIVFQARKAYRRLVVASQGAEWIVERFESCEVPVVSPELLHTGHERHGKVMRFVIAAGDVNDAAGEFAALGRARHERRRGNDHGLYRDELRINDVVAEVGRGIEFPRHLKARLQMGQEAIDCTANRIPLAVRVKRDGTVRLTLEVFEGPVFDGALASLDALDTLLCDSACEFFKPLLAGKTVAALFTSPDSTLFGVELFTMGTPERSPFLGLKVIDSVIHAYR